MRRVTNRCSDGARLRSCPPTPLQDTNCAMNSQFVFRAFCRSNYALQILYGQSIGGAVAIDLAYRNPQAVSRMPLCTPPPADHHNADHCTHRREHFHVPPAAHSVRDALARPVLLPLPPKMGVLSQGNVPNSLTFGSWCQLSPTRDITHDTTRHQNSRRRCPCSCSAECTTKSCRARRCRSFG